VTLRQQRRIKRNDTSPPLRAQIVNASNGQPLDLTGATVRFHMVDEDGALSVDAAALIEAPETNGIVRYDWAAGDTANAGHFDAEFEITLLGGAKETHPQGGFIQVHILEDLDGG